MSVYPTHRPIIYHFVRLLSIFDSFPIEVIKTPILIRKINQIKSITCFEGGTEIPEPFHWLFGYFPDDFSCYTSVWSAELLYCHNHFFVGKNI